MYRSAIPWLLLAPLVVACDWSAPSWPDGAVLELTPGAAHSVEVTWPAAVDDGPVDHYWVSLDGARAFRVDGSDTSATVEGLDPTHPHRIYVVAVDEAGNRSVSLNGEGRASDDEAPIFADGARLNVDIRGGTDDRHTVAQLSWPPARDDVGIAEYIVSDGSGERVRTRAPSAALARDSTDVSDIEVVAVDFAGNRSAPIGSDPATL